ncbi:DUF3501 family protein [Acidiferrimicrobium sp. IK]|uniref:DUF3501 family protein n=1 Tax=Acidiferrimicrobium sp. IK TaxID=2871700 RepID=UPI0021CB1F0A|nr:DUF3501 family protein [Acidiferrimicrobium sp. IK]MCU4184082.1 DUF3501 family protein [Acidiferrimicrobium sp. IK]
MPANTKLTLDDISDLRAYERSRDQFRDRIIALKRRRRVSVGPVVTLVFENHDTILFQVQEMARAERMLSDEAIQTELDTYNPLIPEPGSLSATLFVELTTRAEMEEWLPKLVGVERSVELLIGEGPTASVVRCAVDEGHAMQLTREEITASVHYVRFSLSPQEISRFASEPVVLAINHPAYTEGVRLSDDTKETLLEDLRGA